MLNFAAAWTTNAFKTNRQKDLIIAIGLALCIPIMIAVLYRILNMNYPKDRAEAYYRKTLMLFVAALIIPLIAIMASMIESYILNAGIVAGV